MQEKSQHKSNKRKDENVDKNTSWSESKFEVENCR